MDANTCSVIAQVWCWRPYQQRVLADESRLICVVKARQVGLTELAAVLAVMVALSRHRHDVWLMGTNLEGSKEILWRAKAWYEALRAEDPTLPGVLYETTTQITFTNRSRITALPCSPKAARGKTGTVILDEAAHYAEDEEIWKAIAAVISSTPQLRIMLFSTPNGQRGTFYRAAHGLLDGERLKWSVHKIPVALAVEEGHNPDVYDLRSSYTADQWAQEFECSFLSAAGRYFAPELLNDCAEVEIPEGHARVVARRVLGIDLAQSADQSVMLRTDWDGEQGFRLHSPRILSSKRDPVSYAQQYGVIAAHVEEQELLGEPYDAVIVDATGPGAGLASFLKARFGSLVIEQTITAPWKARYIPALRVDMEAGNVELGVDARIALAFGAVKEERTSANNVVYRQARDEHGHADLFSAGLLGYSVYKRHPGEAPAPGRLVKRGKR